MSAKGTVKFKRGVPEVSPGLSCAPVPTWPAAPVRVALVESELAVAETARVAIEARPEYEFVGHWATPPSDLSVLVRAKPQVLFMELRPREREPFDCTMRLRFLLPDTAVIMVSSRVKGQTVLRSFLAGAKGFLQRPLTPADYLEALDELGRDGVPLSRTAVRAFLGLFDWRGGWLAAEYGLTDQQARLWLCFLSGQRTEKDISTAMGCSEATVHTHKDHLFKKLHIHRCADAVPSFLQVHPPGRDN